MSFAPLLASLPYIIQLIDLVDDIVIRTIDSVADTPDLDPSVEADLQIMIRQKNASAARRDAALNKLQAAIERKRAENG